MPSFFESLSMVALEAWALGKPVLANAKCDVLKGQCIRSNAGLYYESASEFVETLRAIEFNRWIAGSLGKNGRQFFRDHYDWPVIERKYLDMLRTPRRRDRRGAIRAAARLDGTPQGNLPAGRRRSSANIPAGPSVTPEMSVPPPARPRVAAAAAAQARTGA